VIFFLFGVYSSERENLAYKIVSRVRNDLELFFKESDNLLGLHPTYWLEKRRYDGSGVTRNNAESNDLLFLQGFFGDRLELRLIERDGTIQARWPVFYSSISGNITHARNRPQTDWNVGFHGSVILPDGSVVFNIDHLGLFKMDRCGNLVWSVDRPTHHSVEQNDRGEYWVPSSSKVFVSQKEGPTLFSPPYSADELLHVSSTGRIIESLSLMDIFNESGEIGLLTLTGSMGPTTMKAVRPDFNKEVFHLNDVEELSASLAVHYPLFAAGDLLVSLRNRNLIMVVDGASHKIKWWHIGPWVRQHDPDWNTRGTITLFNNNRDGSPDGAILGGSRIMEIDPVTKRSTVLYGDKAGEKFYSIRRGKHQILKNGNILIVEAEQGRIFEVDTHGNITWEYINSYNEQQVTKITNARLYSKDYFAVSDWECNKKNFEQ